MGGASVWQLIIAGFFVFPWLAIPSYFLAKRKGYSRLLWTVLGAIPLVNILSIIYFVGAPVNDERTFD